MDLYLVSIGIFLNKENKYRTFNINYKKLFSKILKNNLTYI